MTVLHAGVTDIALSHAGEQRQLLRDETGIGTAFLDMHEPMFTATAGFEAEQFVNEEILGFDAQATAQRRATVGVRQFAHFSVRSISTTASAASPSPRPTKPSFSVVVAFTEMASISIPSS